MHAQGAGSFRLGRGSAQRLEEVAEVGGASLRAFALIEALQRRDPFLGRQRGWRRVAAVAALFPELEVPAVGFD